MKNPFNLFGVGIYYIVIIILYYDFIILLCYIITCQRYFLYQDDYLRRIAPQTRPANSGDISFQFPKRNHQEITHEIAIT